MLISSKFKLIWSFRCIVRPPHVQCWKCLRCFRGYSTEVHLFNLTLKLTGKVLRSTQPDPKRLIRTIVRMKDLSPIEPNAQSPEMRTIMIPSSKP